MEIQTIILLACSFIIIFIKVIIFVGRFEYLKNNPKKAFQIGFILTVYFVIIINFGLEKVYDLFNLELHNNKILMYIIGIVFFGVFPYLVLSLFINKITNIKYKSKIIRVKNKQIKNSRNKS